MNFADFAFALFLAVTAIAAWILVSRISSLKTSSTVSIFALVLLAGLLFHDPNSNFYVPSDGIFYSEWGLRIAKSWETGVLGLEGVWPGRGVIAVIIAALETLLGAHTFSMITIGAINASTAFLVLRIAASLLSSHRIGNLVPAVLFVSGGAIPFFGAGVLRESFFWLGISLIACSIVLVSLQRYFAFGASFVVGVILILFFRPDFGMLVTTIALTIAILLSARHAYLLQQWTRFVLFGALSVVVLLSTPLMLDLVRPGVDPEGLEIISSGLSNSAVATAFPTQGTGDEGTGDEGSVCLENVLSKSLCQISENLPYVVLGPFPWEIQLEGLWVVLTVSSWHFLFIASIATAVFFFGKKELRPVIIALSLLATASLLIISVILSNYGIVWRFKPIAAIFLFPVVFVGWSQIEDKMRTAVRAHSAKVRERGRIRVPQSFR